MNEVKVFDEREVLGKEFRIYGTPAEPLFKADDVSKWIEHTNTSVMLNKIDESEKRLIQLGTLNNVYSAWFLTEDGLYEVLMQSRKPIAKDFKKQVKIILKSIRQNGAYMTPETIEKTLTDPDFIIQLATKLKDEMAQRKLVEEQLKVEKIKSALVDRMFDAKNSVNIGEVAKLFNERLEKRKAIGQQKMFKILRDERVLMQLGAEKNNPQQRYVDAGYFELKSVMWHDVCGEEHLSSTTKVTPKGIEWLWKFLIKKNYINVNTDIVAQS